MVLWCRELEVWGSIPSRGGYFASCFDLEGCEEIETLVESNN